MSSSSTQGFKGLINCYKDSHYCYMYYQNSFKYLRNLSEVIISLLLVIISTIELIRNIDHWNRSFGKIKKKQILYIFIILSNIGFLSQSQKDIKGFISYNLVRSQTYLFFIEYYFQYLYYSYLIYYFARKVASQNPSKMVVIKIFILSLVTLFTILFIGNIVDYTVTVVDHHSTYELCGQFLFHILRIVGFITCFIFILIEQVIKLNHMLNKSIKENRNSNQTPQTSFMNIQKQQKKLWQQINLSEEFRILVISNVLSSTLLMIQDILLVIKNLSTLNSNCLLFVSVKIIVFNIQQEFGGVEYQIIGFIFKIITYFLPFYMTIILFWRNFSEKSDLKVYFILLKNSKNSEDLEASVNKNYYQGLTYNLDYQLENHFSINDESTE